MSIVGSIIQSAGGGGGAATSFETGSDADLRVEFLEKNLALNTIRDVVAEGSSILEMVDGRVDEYEDETGIDTGASTGQQYFAADDYYTGVTATVSDLLIQSNTTDGSTTFTDESVPSKTVTANGHVQHDTSLGATGDPFGGPLSSILFDGTGDYLSVPDSDDFHFGTGDFTLEAWVRPASTSQLCVFNLAQTSGQYAFSVHVGGGHLYCGFSSNGTTLSNINVLTVGISADTWSHIAITREGTSLRLFTNGVLRSTQTVSTDIFNSTSDLQIGSACPAAVNSPVAFNGHMAGIRLTKGIAQFTANYSVPVGLYLTTGSDMELVSQSFTASSAPSNARFIFIHEPVDAVTINTDIKGFISRDGGTTFTECTLTNDANYDANSDVLCSEDLDISAQPSGTSVVYKIQTYNLKSQRIHASWIQWR